MGHRAAFVSALVAALVSVVASPRARAQSGATTERARAYFDAGTQAFEAGQYRVALRAYDEAYGVEPRPEIAFSMAQAARLLFFVERDPRLLDQALDLYRRYVDAVPSGRRRAHAVQHIAALEAMRALAPPAQPAPDPEPGHIEPSATLLLVVSTTPGATARIDDSDRAAVPVAREVTPGVHRVEVTAPGHFVSVTTWPAVEGRLVVAPVDLRPRPAKVGVVAPEGATIALDGRAIGTAPVAGGVDVPAGTHTVAVHAAGHDSWTKTIRVGPGGHLSLESGDLPLTRARVGSYAAFGGSLALALAGATSAAIAFGAEERALDYEGRVGREPLTPAARAAHEDDVATRDTARGSAMVLFGASAAALGVGAVLYFADVVAHGTAQRSASSPLLRHATGGIAWRLPL